MSNVSIRTCKKHISYYAKHLLEYSPRIHVWHIYLHLVFLKIIHGRITAPSGYQWAFVEEDMERTPGSNERLPGIAAR